MQHTLIILGIIWLAVISPGADFAVISRLSAVEGRQAGIMAATGIAAGCWFHVAYAIYGLVLAEQIFPGALNIIRIAGAAYLIYLGIMLIFARTTTATDGLPTVRTSSKRAFITGMFTNGLNPKTSMFVISLYAQAIGPETPILAQLGYGAIISFSHLLWFCAVAIFLSRPAIRLRVLANQRAVNAVIGCILVLLGMALAFSDVGSGTVA